MSNYAVNTNPAKTNKNNQNSDIDADITANGNGLKLTGALVFSSVSLLLEKSKLLLESQIQSSAVTVNLDCSEVTRIDSAGIALFIEWKRACNLHRKPFSIINLPDQAKSLVETYRLKDVL